MGDIFLVWKVMWTLATTFIYITKVQEPMPTEVHDLVDGDDDNDDPLAKIHKFQLPLLS
jgi:hypothetical protein